VDNTGLLCCDRHGSERPSHKLCIAPPAKRISVAAWEAIVKVAGGVVNDVAITETDLCKSCAHSLIQKRVRDLARIGQDFRSLELLDQIGRADDDQQNVYMSKPWIKRWKARSKTKSFASLTREPWELEMALRKKPIDEAAAAEADHLHNKELLELNCDLRCEHGNLVPDSSLWQEVTPDVWDSFVKQREEIKPGVNRTGREELKSILAEHPDPPRFSIGDVGCKECDAEHQVNVQSAVDTKTRADEERKDEHLSLLFGSHGCVPKTMYTHYIGQKENPLYVVATAWLEKWRLYVAPGKPKLGEPRQPPGPIDNKSLLCPCKEPKLKCAAPNANGSLLNWHTANCIYQRAGVFGTGMIRCRPTPSWTFITTVTRW
jgi:hypothetical protein